MAEDRLIIETAYGLLGITINGTSEYNIRQVSADSLVLTYTRMEVEQSCVCGHLTVDTKPLIGKPIALRIDAHGRVHVLSGPTGDASGGGMTDPATEFGGMLWRFPQSLLFIGATWADSAQADRSDRVKRGSEKRSVQRKGRYAVDADTTIAGTAAWVVKVMERVRHEDRFKSARSDVEGVISVEGDDTGWVAVAKDGSGSITSVEHASLEGVLDIPARGGLGAKSASLRIVSDATLTRLP